MNLNLVTHDDLQGIMEKIKAEMLSAIEQMILKKNSSQKEWLKTKEARTLLSCSVNTLNQLRFEGKIKAKKINGCWYYYQPSINEFFQSRN